MKPHAHYRPPDHSKGDESTIGGYMAVHDRPAAFEGSDGFSYSVEIIGPAVPPRTYTFDPEHPVPTVGGSLCGIMELPPETGDLDQMWRRFISPVARLNPRRGLASVGVRWATSRRFSIS